MRKILIGYILWLIMMMLGAGIVLYGFGDKHLIGAIRDLESAKPIWLVLLFFTSVVLYLIQVLLYIYWVSVKNRKKWSEGKERLRRGMELWKNEKENSFSASFFCSRMGVSLLNDFYMELNMEDKRLLSEKLKQSDIKKYVQENLTRNNVNGQIIKLAGNLNCIENEKDIVAIYNRKKEPEICYNCIISLARMGCFGAVREIIIKEELPLSLPRLKAIMDALGEQVEDRAKVRKQRLELAFALLKERKKRTKLLGQYVLVTLEGTSV